MTGTRYSCSRTGYICSSPPPPMSLNTGKTGVSEILIEFPASNVGRRWPDYILLKSNIGGNRHCGRFRSERGSATFQYLLPQRSLIGYRYSKADIPTDPLIARTIKSRSHNG